MTCLRSVTTINQPNFYKEAFSVNQERLHFHWGNPSLKMPGNLKDQCIQPKPPLSSFCNLESNSSIQLPKPVNGMWIILLYCHSDEFPREIPISTLFTRWFVHWSISPSWFYKNFNHFIIFWNKQKEKIELRRYQVVIIWLLHENAFFIFDLNQMQTVL